MDINVKNSELYWVISLILAFKFIHIHLGILDGMSVTKLHLFASINKLLPYCCGKFEHIFGKKWYSSFKQVGLLVSKVIHTVCGFGKSVSVS